MSRHSPFVIELREDERRVLDARVRKRTAEHGDVPRCADRADGSQREQNATIADRLGIRLEHGDQVAQRFFEEAMAGLDDRQRPGRPRAFRPSGGGPGQNRRL